MKHNKIGFYQPEADDPEEKEDSTGNEKLKEYIRQLYKPNGFSHEKDFKTSLELAYELSDMIEVTPNKVAEVMNELGYEVTSIENQVCFVIFITEK
ncbi:MAG TPA: hypothetical protein P5084_12395 [Paludibacter sp.]|nr:hypothetical protein [Paludibacter sp.]